MAPIRGPGVPSLETVGLACDIEMDAVLVRTMYDNRIFTKLKLD